MAKLRLIVRSRTPLDVDALAVLDFYGDVDVHSVELWSECRVSNGSCFPGSRDVIFTCET